MIKHSINIYGPLNTQHVHPIRFHVNELEILNNRLLRNKIILADANSHHTLWGDRRNCPRGRKIVDFISNDNLVCLNKEPTYIAPKTGKCSSIDVSLVSPQLSLDAEWSTHSDMLGSDHIPIY